MKQREATPHEQYESLVNTLTAADFNGGGEGWLFYNDARLQESGLTKPQEAGIGTT
jgi:hypothetical protein